MADEYKGKAPELSILTGWLKFSQDAAQKKHWEYFVIDQFLKGNHNVRGNPQDNTIEVTKRVDSVNYPINKMKRTFRGVKNFITRNKPKVTIEPDVTQPDPVTYARRSQKVIERDNKLNNGRKLNKEWVHEAVKNGLGWRQIGYDKEKHVTVRWTVSAWDLLVGAQSGEPEDAPYLIKCVKRTIGYWKHKYPNKVVTADNKLAADQYQELSLQIEYQNVTAGQQNEDEQTAIGYECWYRVFKPNSKGGLINKCLFTESDIIDFEETPYKDYPFIPYKVEINPGNPSPDSYLKDVIAPQRMLNLLNTQMLEYNHVVNRGRIILDKNSGFKRIAAKEGDIIYKNAGKRVEVLNPPAVNPLLQWQLSYADEAIQDIGVQQDASRGKLPSAGMSGDAIQALQEADTSILSDPRDNFEDALSLEAAWILKMYSLFEDEGVVMSEPIPNQQPMPGQEQQNQQFGVVGQGYKQMEGEAPGKYFIEDNGSYCDACTILPENQVSVSIVSELGETKEARLNLMFQLAKLGLPLKTILEHIEFPNASDVMERMAEETLADMAMQQIGAQAQAFPAEQQQTQGKITQVLDKMQKPEPGGK